MIKVENVGVVYVAGPYRGKNTFEIKRNIRTAEEVGIEVMALGAMPLIPLTNLAH